MAVYWVRALSPSLAAVTLHQRSGHSEKQEACSRGTFSFRGRLVCCADIRSCRWRQDLEGPALLPPREGSPTWLTNATTASHMTLSTFLRFLEDVDKELAAKGSAGLMRLRPEALPEGDAVLSAADVELLLRYSQVAAASYGPALLNPVFYPDLHAGVPPSLGSVSGWTQVAQSHLPIGIEILYAQPSSTWLRPAYFIAVDSERHCAILSIRGTLSPEDLLTDLSAEEVETPWGPSHKGMLMSAQALLEEARPKLEEVLDSRGLDKLVVVGHSLGGGIATYASLWLEVLREPAGPHVSISCYAFGAPGLAHFDRAAAPGSGSVSIVTVVNGYDWISRLSYGHVIDLLHRGHGEFQTMLGVVESFLRVQKKEEAVDNAPQTKKEKPTKLYPCGEIVLLSQGQGAVRSSQKLLENLQLHPSMFAAHLPHNYEMELRSALASKPTE